MGGAKKKTKASVVAANTAPIKEDCSNYEYVRDKLISDLAAAVAANDVKGMMKVTYFVEGLTGFGYPKLHEFISSSAEYNTYFERTTVPYHSWRSKIAVGDTVDTLRVEEKVWYEAKILEIDHKSDKMKVHYNGWASAHDEVLSIMESIAVPQNTFTAERKKPVKLQPRYQDEIAALPAQEEAVETARSSTQTDAETVPEVLDRNSRRRSRADASTVSIDNGATADAANGDDKLKSEKPKEEKDLNDWICGICGWLEAADGSDLVLCEGNLLLIIKYSCNVLLLQYLLYLPPICSC